MTDSMNCLTPRDRRIVAIDPGTNGGIAFFDGTMANLVISTKFCKEWEDTLFWMCGINKPLACRIERVHSILGNGGSSMFTFGDSYGSARTAIKLAKVPIEYVEPQSWMQVLGLPPRREFIDKAKRRKVRRGDQEFLARKLFPICRGWDADKEGDIFAALLIGYAAQVEHLPVQMRGVHEIVYPEPVQRKVRKSATAVQLQAGPPGPPLRQPL